jgi:DNA-binding NarL/FixJ family response regulator
MMSSDRAQAPTPASPLTPRELEVLGLVATGLRSRVVAARLGLREATVRRHLYNIYRKLGVANRVAATTWYLENYRDTTGTGG